MNVPKGAPTMVPPTQNNEKLREEIMGRDWVRFCCMDKRRTRVSSVVAFLVVILAIWKDTIRNYK